LVLSSEFAFLCDCKSSFRHIPHGRQPLQVDIDFKTQPTGEGKDGRKVYLRDIWPSNEEVATVSQYFC